MNINLNINWGFSIASFILGGMLTYFLSLQSKEKIKEILLLTRSKGWRFFKHTISLVGVFFATAVAYFIFDKINYGKEMLPNLISSALSVLIIDFLLKERALAEQNKINILINDKINSVIKNINKIILKFINLEDVEKSRLTDEIISSILSKQNLAEETLEYQQITEDGQVLSLEISKFDFTFYVAKEIEPEVSNLIQNYNRYLSAEQICNLIKLKEILSSKIFKVRYSTYKNITQAEYKLFESLLIKALIELNYILNLINK
ncbi:hypothetical protein [Clostridium butyricum]|uniref:hypothetical protein n=1 Tax=Clostridium butyricum TaxID=1492 RepID=UPI0012B8F373|nr:hypothetical protein [Clostridium butyricum]